MIFSQVHSRILSASSSSTDEDIGIDLSDREQLSEPEPCGSGLKRKRLASDSDDGGLPAPKAKKLLSSSDDSSIHECNRSFAVEGQPYESWSPLSWSPRPSRCSTVSAYYCINTYSHCS